MSHSSSYRCAALLPLQYLDPQIGFSGARRIRPSPKVQECVHIHTSTVDDVKIVLRMCEKGLRPDPHWGSVETHKSPKGLRNVGQWSKTNPYHSFNSKTAICSRWYCFWRTFNKQAWNNKRFLQPMMCLETSFVTCSWGKPKISDVDHFTSKVSCNKKRNHNARQDKRARESRNLREQADGRDQ